MNDNPKFKKIIPVGNQKFAYQSEGISMPIVIRGSIPYRNGYTKGGKESYENQERDKLREYDSYELVISRHTANAVTVGLNKFYKDGTVKAYQTTMSFSDLVNQIFADVEVGEYDFKV